MWAALGIAYIGRFFVFQTRRWIDSTQVQLVFILCSLHALSVKWHVNWYAINPSMFLIVWQVRRVSAWIIPHCWCHWGYYSFVKRLPIASYDLPLETAVMLWRCSVCANFSVPISCYWSTLCDCGFSVDLVDTDRRIFSFWTVYKGKGVTIQPSTLSGCMANR